MSSKIAIALINTFTLSLAACGSQSGSDPAHDLGALDDTEDAIVGGVFATAGEFPWMTALVAGSGANLFQFCGGSLVADRWVVTAAHCVEGSSPADQRVGIGRLRISNLTETDLSDVVRIEIHPQYDPATSDNDIALLELAESFAGTRTLPMLTAADEAAVITAGRNTTIVGWGSTSEGGNTVNRLRKANVPIVGRARCRDLYAPRGVAISGVMICAGDLDDGGEDTCQGDSGGPLIVGRNANARLAGVTSFGIGCARRRFPGVYSNVARLSAWANACIAGDCN